MLSASQYKLSVGKTNTVTAMCENIRVWRISISFSHTRSKWHTLAQGTDHIHGNVKSIRIQYSSLPPIPRNRQSPLKSSSTSHGFFKQRQNNFPLTFELIEYDWIWLLMIECGPQTIQVIGVFTNTQNWQHWKLCILLHLLFHFLFAPYDVSKCEIRCQWVPENYI